MEITEVRIKLMEEPGERLRAFCSITFDNSFVVRDLKIIDGTNGPFVAMPSRKLTMHCPRCRCKNHLKAAYCNQCGLKLEDSSEHHRDELGRNKLYADIAHPINSACREMIQQHVVSAFEEELEKSKQPGYVSSYDDFGEDSTATYSGDGPHFSMPKTEFDKTEPTGNAAPHFEQKKDDAPQKEKPFGTGIFTDNE